MAYNNYQNTDLHMDMDADDDTAYRPPHRGPSYTVAPGAAYAQQPYDYARDPARSPSPRSVISPVQEPVRRDPFSQIPLPQAQAQGQYDQPWHRDTSYTRDQMPQLGRQRSEDIPMQITPPKRKPVAAPLSQQSASAYSIPAPPAQIHSDNAYAVPVPPPHAYALDQTHLRPQGYTDRPSPPPERGYSPYGDTQQRSRDLRQHHSYDSSTGLAAAAAEPGFAAGYTRDPSPGRMGPTPASQRNSHLDDQYGYQHSQVSRERVNLGAINPLDIDDDDDEPFTTLNNGKRPGAFAGMAAGPAANLFKPRDASGNYGAVPGGGAAMGGVGGEEKSNWLQQQTSGKKRTKWLVGGLIVLVIVLAVTGGVIGVLLSHQSSSSDAPKSLSELQNNPDLHKVFPGIDYTPLNSIYPACLTDPPLQKNITMDVAVLAQLTPHLRLYGTDCNVTDMVLAAISELGLTASVKVWAGAYLDANTTTNNRQLEQLYDVLSRHGADPFAGVIVGNEVLFSEYMTEAQLIDQLTQTRTKLNDLGLSALPLATSDLGSKWTTELAAAVDVVMSNIHPFFAGVPASTAASWTWDFWQNNDVDITGDSKRQIIAETGWPSQGGNDCGTDVSGKTIPCGSSTAGSVASIDGLNTFLSEWVCQAMTNSTEYFWFEAFDEPWKVIFNEPGESWETNWGLMDVNRNLKSGINIPDCGGREASL